MSPEERVGQLFLVTFQGTDLGPETEIFDLITNQHIGGVILLARNNNFNDPENLPAATLQLTQDLQRLEAENAAVEQSDPITGESFLPNYVPLFIGTVQEGNGYPNDQLLTGFSALPSPLALGATWQPGLARQVGEVVGRELSAVGINLLLGPSLDVLETPSADRQGDLGTRTYGGDPFWVGEMGRAYIAGVHTGSDNRIALVAKHFPGHGGSDRLPEDEVATVRKSLEQLRQIELAPFFAVTGDAPSPEGTVDALLTSHIRYQGLQGNIRATTNPISFDPAAFERIMSQQPFVTWRGAGGVVISDDLGSRAVRRFYDPDGQTFNGRIVALNAFLAGNDILYLGDISSSNDPSAYFTILRTLEFFAQKYREDPAFAQRVDLSVLRILSLKYKLYDRFLISQVLPNEIRLTSIGEGEQVTFEVARQATTLISPPPSELDNVLPEPPALFDRMIFFTDSNVFQQCAECPEQAGLGTDDLRQAVIRLYGPEAGGQILPFNLISFSFDALTQVLNSPPGDTILEQTLRSADWVVFLMTDEDENRPASLALSRFLAERPTAYRNKKLIVFALDAPYFLDATDISKLTAYYGLYSKVPQFVDVAARLLFKELRPIPGSLPVSVPGVGYDLISATSPDPEQVIPLHILDPEAEAIAEGEFATPATIPEYKVGDLVTVRAGVILDHNGHPVPNETPIQFILSVGGQETAPQIKNSIGGMADFTFVIESAGTLSLIARSGEPPAVSNALQFEIPTEDGAIPLTTTPPPPTETPTREPTATDRPPTPSPTPEETGAAHTETDIGDWFLALLASGVIGWVAFQVGNTTEQLRWGFRWGLCALIGGLVVYTSLSLNFPGTAWFMENWGRWAAIILSVAGAGLGWTLGVAWHSLDQARAR